MVGKIEKMDTLPINGSESLLNMKIFHFISVAAELWNMLVFLVHHTISNPMLSVLGQCYRIHSMSLICSREVIQLISTTILLRHHSMFIVLEPVLHQHHSISNHDTFFVSLMGDASRTSYEGSLPVEISSLSKKLT